MRTGALPLCWTNIIWEGKSGSKRLWGGRGAHYARKPPERTAERCTIRGLQGRALDALASGGGTGRDRVALSPGSISFGDRDNFLRACAGVPERSWVEFDLKRCGRVVAFRAGECSAVHFTVRLGEPQGGR